MPPLGSAGKSKNKTKDVRPPRSRNTTPSIANEVPTGTPSLTPLLQLDTSKLLVPARPSYQDILERLESKSFPDSRTLQIINDEVKQLHDCAEKRVEVCERGIRSANEKRKEFEQDQQDNAQASSQAKKTKPAKKMDSSKNVKAKKRKERTDTGEVEIKREDEPLRVRLGRASETPVPTDTPSPSKKIKHSPDTSSSLSDVGGSPKPKLENPLSPAPSDTSVEENRIIHKPAMPAGGYFPDTLAPDPTIYHIRKITPDLDEETKKEIYSVTSYPTNDVSDQIAGTPPDKDFSNSKPQTQVLASTFQQFIEPYVRPLAEEDMAFLRERGDRLTPFLAVPRGKRHWQEIWDEADGTNLTRETNKLTITQPNGSLEDVDDDNVGKDTVSSGPLASRLLSLLRFEHRNPSADASNDQNIFGNGDDTMDLDGLTNGDFADKPEPPAASVVDFTGSGVSQKLDYVQSDERIKGELRFLGLLGQEENPDYDAHNDDDISERLRLLQAELRRVMLVNSARKARLLDLARERLAWQEYTTIHDDLDSQVQTAYLKRTRTLGKTKKGGPGGNKLRPGVAAIIPGMSRARDIGDSARILMKRREKWRDCIGPVFENMEKSIRGKDDTIWDPKDMEQYEKAELEAMDEEGD